MKLYLPSEFYTFITNWKRIDKYDKLKNHLKILNAYNLNLLSHISTTSVAIQKNVRLF